MGATPKDYGSYDLNAAQLLTLPQLTSKGTIDWFAAPPTERLADTQANLAGTPEMVGMKRIRIGSVGMSGNGKRRRFIAPPPPPPVVPPISSVAVMDVGQGNCNVLIDSNHVPVTYYDVGYPLPFFINSAPPNMQFNNVAWQGPYQPTSLNGMNVVLSHWDWDHWRLGHVANLTGLNWTYPNQAVGPSAANFIGQLGVNANVFVGAVQVVTHDYAIVPCAPLGGMPPASIMNNSGLALWTATSIPSVVVGGYPAPHRVMLTADANFNCLAGVVNPAAPAWTRLVAITAVHHGSNNYGASNNLPAPAIATGRIAYSYGVSSVSGNHPYGFPGNVAVGNYQGANWGPGGAQERSTAEANAIHPVGAGPLPPPPPAARGNVRIGDQTPLVYANTAFTTFPLLAQLS